MNFTSTTQSVEFTKNDIILPNMPDFDLLQTLDCGQAFRWSPQPDGSYLGIVHKKVCHISQLDGCIVLYGVSETDYKAIWRSYFDLDRDYTALKTLFSSDSILAKAVDYAPGIRVLRQDPWEALCSFIISQNNNVKRIKGIVERLCMLCGEEIGAELYAFPDPETLAALTPEDLSPIRAGFRSRYLIDAAQKVASGAVQLDALSILPLADAREMLLQITGVGIKVAECALLYGCGRVECFPVDVWIKRVMEILFPNGLPACTNGVEGIAQQYLFHYARTSEDFRELF